MYVKDTQPLVDAAGTDDYCWMPYQIARAEYIPFQQKLAQEEAIYFVPSVIEGEKHSGLYCVANYLHMVDDKHLMKCPVTLHCFLCLPTVFLVMQYGEL